MNISDQQISLLSQILNHSAGNPDGISAQRFRVDYASLLDSLDQLEWDEVLLRRDHKSDRYHLRMAALPLLHSDTAQALLEDISKVFTHLQKGYQENLQQPIPLKSIASHLSLDRRRVNECITYLRDPPLISYTTDLSDPKAIVQPSESVLRYQQFADLLDWWCNTCLGIDRKDAGKEDIPKKTTKANQKRQSQKVIRHQRLRWFVGQIEERLDAGNYSWKLSCIPGTKTQFAEIFFDMCPEVKKVSPFTLADDLHQLGVRFAQGYKNNEFNALSNLFHDG